MQEGEGGGGYVCAYRREGEREGGKEAVCVLCVCVHTEGKEGGRERERERERRELSTVYNVC